MKKILRSIIFILCFVLLSTGCTKYSKSKVEKIIYDYFGDSFELKTISSYETEDGYIFEMKANNETFYVRSKFFGIASDGGTRVYTTILSSFYQKHKLKIEQIAYNNGLDIQFAVIDYSSVPEFPGYLITINADKNQLSDIQNFVNEVISIPDINKLYNLLYANGGHALADEMLIDECSTIKIYDGEKMVDYPSSIFYTKHENIINIVQ